MLGRDSCTSTASTCGHDFLQRCWCAALPGHLDGVCQGGCRACLVALVPPLQTFTLDHQPDSRCSTTRPAINSPHTRSALQQLHSSKAGIQRL